MDSSQPFRPNLGCALVGFTLLFGLFLVGTRLVQSNTPAPGRAISTRRAPALQPTKAAQAAAAGEGDAGGGLRAAGGPILTPTPDAPHALPAARTRVEQYVVQAGDSLAQIALRFQVSLEQLVQENNLSNPNYVEVGQVLTIPLPDPANSGPAFKIIPDSELVRGPATADFDVAAFVEGRGGYLASYTEKIAELGDRRLSGAEIVERIAQDFSVNPRLLLAVLEYQSAWVTDPSPKENTLEYPLRWREPLRKDLYHQLEWAANQLNYGYYLWRAGAIGAWLLADSSVTPINPTINAGTAGVQNLFAALTDRAGWNEAVSASGLQETYQALFGYPFDYAFEPLLPPDLKQPEMQLPFENGKVWSFTGGPHGGWASGSAWAALDFAPPGEALGCVLSDEWAVAVADGTVVRASDGAVVLDLDGDGLEQTGWAVYYLHIDSHERVTPGTVLKAGQRIGHPSCEGGVSNGTHVHIARKYNGEWIPADQDLPFVMDGWVSSGTKKEYDGYLSRGLASIEASATRAEINQIER